jgi:hypothetical protein
MTGPTTDSRGTVVDALAVLVLVTLTLSILDDSYSDRSYLVAGLVPAVVLLALAALARRVHEGVWWYALGVVVLFAPLGALVALRRPGPYGPPTFDTMNRVLGESISAPTTLVSTVPPVDAAGQVMLVPFVIGFLAVAAAAWLALATQSPLAPLVPLVVALAATIPLGVLVPGLLVPRGIVFAIVAVAWAAARARRREALVGEARGTAAAAVAGLLVVTLVSGLVSLLVPDDNEVDRVLLRGDSETVAVSGAAETTVPRRVGTRNELFVATGVPEGRRVRFAALDRYDGQAWVPAEVSPGSDGTGTFKRIGHDIAALHPGRSVGVRIRMRPGYAGDWLPMLGELTSLDLDYTDGRTQITDVRYNQATSSALVVGGVNPRDDYTFTSVLTDDELARTEPTREPTEEQRQPEGAFLDQYLRPFERAEVTPLGRVMLLARYLRLNGAVRLTGSSSQSSVDLGIRMLGSRQMAGTPFQYSALMALGASRLGVPARVVTGAEPGRGGLVTHDDVTSWVELQFADGTWRTLEPVRYVGVHAAADDERRAQEDRNVFVLRELDDLDKDYRFPKGTFLGLDDEDVRRGDEVTPTGLALATTAALGGLALLVLLLVPLAKVLRRARRRRTSSWSGLYVNGWQEVLDAARDRGTPVPEGWSRFAQAAELGVGADLARRADAAVFAPGAPDARDGREFWEACQGLRRQLVAEKGLRGRLRAHLNPASLMAGWARGRRSARQVRHEDRGARRQQAAGA